MNKLVIQIIVLSVAGLLTLGLSIYGLMENDKKEKLLDLKQHELINSQKQMIHLQQKHAGELQSKSDEIIKLQNQLQEKSVAQIKTLNRMINPIPISLSMMLTTSLVLSQNEYNEILHIYKLKFPTSKTNFLPFEFPQSNQGFEKINAFKNVFFQIQVIFKKGEKEMHFRFEKKPLKLMGYNTNEMNNVFTLYLDESSKKVGFDGLTVETEKISTNYKEPSILDFENSEVSILYDFFYPQPKQLGNNVVNLYIATNREFVTLDIHSIILNTKNYMIELKDLKKIDSHQFQTHWKGL